MTIARQPVANLDPAVVATLQADMTARLQVAFPNLDFRRGVFHDRVLYLSAVLAADEENLISNVQQAMSLLDIQANPALADPALVDSVLSNFRISRIQGGTASGQIMIVVSALSPLTLPSGMTFTAGSVQIVTTQVTAVRTSSSQVVAASDQVLSPQPDGTYVFTLQAAAVAVGTAGMLTRGTAVIPDQPPPNFVKAYVPSDWSGGSNTETNAALMARLQAGIAAPGLSNRSNITALVLSQFPGVVNMSIIGSGDPELNRARRGLFPISLPGYCDIYVRSASLPLQTVLSKTATFIGETPQGGIWQFALTAADAPGFYRVTQILSVGADPAAAGYGILSDVRGFDLSGTGMLPDVELPTEGTYSAFQTAVIQFLDTSTPTAGLVVGASTATYTVVTVGQPQLAAIQTYLSSRQRSSPSGDILVKGAVPCNLRLNFVAYVAPGNPAPDTNALAQTLAQTVNALGFAGRLFASTLIDAMASALPAGTALGPLDMFGQIRRPDGRILSLRDSAVLVVPSDPTNYVTPRTVVFVLDPADVSISVQTLTTPEI